MSRDSWASVLVLAGVACLAAGAWLLHPAAGLGVIGLASVAIGVGIVRTKGNYE